MVEFVSGNSTVGPDGNSTDASGTNSSEALSRGDIFGMLLTLSFCLLTQPAGSILYRPWCFLLWRVNPLACALEVVGIAWCLAESMFFALRSQNVLANRERTLKSWASATRDLVRLLNDDLYAAAGALLLLRTEPDDERLDETLELLMLEESSKRGVHEEDVVVAELVSDSGDDLSEISVGVLDKDSGLDDEESSPSIANRAVHDDSNAPPPQPCPSTASKDEEQAISEPLVTIKARSSGNASDNIFLIHRAIGANAFAHRQLAVQAVTFLSIASVTAKLFVNEMPWGFRVCGFCMLASWVSVQALLFIFHSRAVEKTDFRAVRERIRDTPAIIALRSGSGSTIWVAFAILICVPTSYIATTINFPHSKGVGEPTTVQAAVSNLFFILGYAPLLLVGWVLASQKYLSVRESSGRWLSWAIFLGPALITAVLIYSLTLDFEIGNEENDRESVPFVLYVVVRGVNVSLTMCYFIFGLLAGMSIFTIKDRNAIILTQVFLVIGSILAFWDGMIRFDPSGSRQPSWVNWLG